MPILITVIGNLLALKMGVSDQSSWLDASVKANAMMRWNRTGQLECVDVPV
jgi:hypothetical protein